MELVSEPATVPSLLVALSVFSASSSSEGATFFASLIAYIISERNV